MVRWQWKNWICRLVFPLKIGWCTETPRGPVSNACPWPCSRIINRTRSKVNIALVAHSPQPIASVHPYKNGKNVQQSNHRKKNIQASTRPTPFLPQVFHVFLQRDRLMTYAKRPFAAGSGWKAVHGSASSKVRGRLQQGQWPRQPWGSPSSWWDILCVCACLWTSWNSWNLCQKNVETF